MSYSREEIIEYLENLNAYEGLYNDEKINRTGVTSDTKEFYTEVIAEWLINNQDAITKTHIKQITREKSYKTKSHNGIQTNEKSNRAEEIQAKKLFVQYQNSPDTIIGKMIDYQTPLKNIKSDTAGKIDIMSYNDKDNTLFMFELKREKSEETLLRCILEIITYSHIVNIDKLCNDFSDDKTNIVNPNIVCAPIIVENSKQYKEYIDLKEGKRPKLKALIDIIKTKTALRFFAISGDNQYLISEFVL